MFFLIIYTATPYQDLIDLDICHSRHMECQIGVLSKLLCGSPGTKRHFVLLDMLLLYLLSFFIATVHADPPCYQFALTTELMPAGRTTYGRCAYMFNDKAIVSDTGQSKAYYYTMDPTDRTWSQHQVVTGANALGMGCTLNTNNSALAYNSATNRVDLYKENGPSWAFDQQINGLPASSYGAIMDMYSDNLIAVAAKSWSTNKGRVYIYEMVSGVAVIRLNTSAFDETIQDFFGSSLSLYNDTLVVGSPFDDDEATNSGSVYVYTRQCSVSTDWTFSQKIVPNPQSGALAGTGVSVVDRWLVIGSPAGIGAIIFYYKEDNGTFVFNQLFNSSGACIIGNMVKLSSTGRYLAVGCRNNVNSGNIQMYSAPANKTGTWTFVQTLVPTTSAVSFSATLSMSDYCVIGGTNQGTGQADIFCETYCTDCALPGTCSFTTYSDVVQGGICNGVAATTGVQTTGIQTTGVQTTGVQTTSDPTTGVQTTDVQTTSDPTTGVQTTSDPTTGVQTTGVQTTSDPTTGVQTTSDPTTGVQTTGVQTTSDPTTGVQTTGVQTTSDTTTGVQTTGVQTTSDPTTGVQTTGVQTTSDPTTGVQTTGVQTTGVQTTGVQTTGVQTTGVQTTGDPTTGVQTTGVQTTGIQTTGVQTTNTPTTGVQTTGVHTTTGVQTTGIQTTITTGASQEDTVSSSPSGTSSQTAIIIGCSVAGAIVVIIIIVSLSIVYGGRGIDNDTETITKNEKQPLMINASTQMPIHYSTSIQQRHYQFISDDDENTTT
jgi:hypothetical protein